VSGPDDPSWDALTPTATGNIIERDFIDSSWPVGIYKSRSARDNAILNVCAQQANPNQAIARPTPHCVLSSCLV